MKAITIGCTALALAAAVFYFLMGAGVVTVPSLNAGDAAVGIVYAAGACYALGGLLILIRKRWLWVVGLVMNALVIGVFFVMYKDKPDIMFSVAGLTTKIPQILLEVGLIYLVANFRKTALVAMAVGE